MASSLLLFFVQGASSAPAALSSEALPPAACTAPAREGATHPRRGRRELVWVAAANLAISASSFANSRKLHMAQQNEDQKPDEDEPCDETASSHPRDLN